MTNIVYRIQDKEGRGPWKPGLSKHWVEPRPDHDNLVPWYAEFGQVHLRAIVGMNIVSAPTYIINRGHDGRKSSISAQVRMCGNSVDPKMATAFLASNAPWLAVRRAA